MRSSAGEGPRSPLDRRTAPNSLPCLRRGTLPITLVAILGLFLAATEPVAEGAGQRQTHVFHIEGMTCALCGKAISKALHEVEGVQEIEIDQRTDRVRVVVAPEVTAEMLERAIESAGRYEAEAVPSP
ncbi:MAG: heavy-metal-associated domain-containing protein [Myxococcota bacterium]